ncbi:MAG: metalloregulator ArsR/SmtB family transcription factor [Polyangiaceae bacterium]
MSSSVDQILAALADPTRREIVELLCSSPRRSSDLADYFSMSRPAMSKHLKILREAGLIEQELLDSDGRVRVIQLRREPLEGLRGWLDEVEAFWEDQLASFKQHAERRSREPR